MPRVRTKPPIKRRFEMKDENDITSFESATLRPAVEEVCGKLQAMVSENTVQEIVAKVRSQSRPFVFYLIQSPGKLRLEYEEEGKPVCLHEIA
jgi:hypothetical protein